MIVTRKSEILLAQGLVYVSSRNRLFAKLPREAATAERGRHWVRYYWPAGMVAALEELHPAKTRLERTPGTVDLLAAIFGATRAAKRCRDGAARSYANGMHGLAGHNRERKEQLYGLKDRGIVAAHGAGRLCAVATHGPLTVYRGEGYCFHSLLRPKFLSVPLPDLSTESSAGELIFVEAKPREAREPRLKDVVHTLSALPELPANDGLFLWEKKQFPPRRRARCAWEDEEDEEICN